MLELPSVSSKIVISALKKLNYKVDHQTGSHKILRCSEYPYRRITIPNHDPIAKGTLRAIIRQIGLTKEEFLNLLEK